MAGISQRERKAAWADKERGSLCVSSSSVCAGFRYGDIKKKRGGRNKEQGDEMKETNR